jgi:hypothetical protein
MALQTSGAISFSQMQTEFGGANPISLSEYYKNGSYVPSTVGGAAGSWGSYTTNINYYYNMQNITNIGVNYWIVYANGSTTAVGTNLTLDSNNRVVIGSYEYERAATAHTFYVPSGKTSAGQDSYFSYHYRKRTASTSVTVNANIPTSGVISMNNMYGGRNT